MNPDQTCRTYKKLAFLRTCQSYMENVNMTIPLKEFERIVDKSEALTEEWQDMYYDEEAQKMGFMDTCVRDTLQDAISREYLGVDWPLYMDGANYMNMWRIAFRLVMKSKGYYNELQEDN